MYYPAKSRCRNTMRWMDIKHGKGMPDKRVIPITIQQLGFSKFVYVKTKSNGGLNA